VDLIARAVGPAGRVARAERPFVYVNMAMTVDGKITSASREYPAFASDRDRLSMDRLRAEADAIVIGAGTLRADDPPMNIRDHEMLDYRRSLGKPDDIPIVVVSAGLDLDPGSRFFRPSGPTRIIATVEDAPLDRVRRLEQLAEVWKLGRGRVDLAAMLSKLREHGVERLLVEGGGRLNWAFVAADLVDELYVTVAPALLGGQSAPTLVDGDGYSMDSRVRLALLSVDRHGDELYCRYEVKR
jgi:2,5-diamino-6-(ribosylamino)-4(3H)-pyrimidinone 5'-phosphate reductase